MKTRIFLFLVLLMFVITEARAQTTAFTYQGKLTDSGSAPNGNYDLTFQLFDTSTVGVGAQLGATLNLNSVPVSSGIFTVQLDFGACASCFNGANRFLEIAVRPSGGGSFTTLSPRQPISSTPYAVRSVGAATADGLSPSCVSCVTSAQIQSVQGSQVTGAVAGGQINGTIPLASVPAGSASYIQNGTGQQASSNFNVSGDGTAGGTLSGNTINAGSFFSLGGQSVLNASQSGLFVGGFYPAIRIRNNVGIGTLTNPTTNISGGAQILALEGISNTTLIMTAEFPTLQTWEWQNIKIGNNRVMNLSNITGGNNPLTVLDNGNIGVSNVAPTSRLHVLGNNANVLRVEKAAAGGSVASFGGFGDFSIDAGGAASGRLMVKENGNVGIGLKDPPSKLYVAGDIRLEVLGSGGSQQLCYNNVGAISSCSSSLRYKTDLHPFIGGLNLVNRLQPITFKWKADQSLDLGLGAEDVAAIEPLLVTHNKSGQVEGVKYDRLSAVFINAFKEQQTQIEQQGAQIKAQQNQIKSQDKAFVVLRTRLASLEEEMRHLRPRQRKAFRSRR